MEIWRVLVSCDSTLKRVRLNIIFFGHHRERIEARGVCTTLMQECRVCRHPQGGLSREGEGPIGTRCVSVPFHTPLMNESLNRRDSSSLFLRSAASFQPGTSTSSRESE